MEQKSGSGGVLGRFLRLPTGPPQGHRGQAGGLYHTQKRHLANMLRTHWKFTIYTLTTTHALPTTTASEKP